MEQDHSVIEGGMVAGSAPAGGTVKGEKTSMGLEPKMAVFLIYLLTGFISFISGLIFYLVEKENRFVRFHALQSIFFCIATIVLWVAVMVVSGILAAIPIIGWIIGTLLMAAIGIGAFVYWVILMIKALQGEDYKIPVISNWAENALK